MSAEWTDADVPPVADALHRLGLCDDASELDVPPCWTHARALLASGVVVPARLVEAVEGIAAVRTAQRDRIRDEILPDLRARTKRAEIDLSRFRSAVEALADASETAANDPATTEFERGYRTALTGEVTDLRALLAEGRDRAGEGARS